MNIGDEITVNSRRYDNTLKKSWKCRITDIESNALILVGEFVDSVTHPDLGIIEAGTISTEYFWLDRWYNIFRFDNPDGTFRNWYCNLCMPPTLGVNVLDYVDLEIDVLIWPDGRFQVLDEDEFAQNSRKFGYSAEVVRNTALALKELLELHRNMRSPFGWNTVQHSMASPV